VVALTDQNRVLSALRGTEVVSDPTNVLALECALRLRRSPGQGAHFATSHRVIRTQPVPKQPGYAPHFRIFALANGGIESKDHAFTVETMTRHVRTMLGGIAKRTPLEHPYYSGGLRYMLWVTTPDGAEVPLIDGGAFDWLAKLASNRRAVYIAIGAGAQLVALLFRSAPSS
jgi:hypothetical protein